MDTRGNDNSFGTSNQGSNNETTNMLETMRRIIEQLQQASILQQQQQIAQQ